MLIAMYAYYLAATAVFAAIGHCGPAPLAPWNAVNVVKRQMNANSTCQVFGVDIQSGGSYFINVGSNADFMTVTQFEGCNNDTASVMLINNDVGDQYYCTDIPTVPDDTPEMSTCPVEKSQLVTGNYSIITIGNNGNGNPFAVERDFVLTVGQQQTTTVTVSVPYTLTTQSTSTVTTTSTITSTSTVQDKVASTEVTTSFQTTTPQGATTTTTEVVLRTFYRWTKTQATSTSVVTASCTIPPRAERPDPPCRIFPTGVAVPEGLKIQGRASGDERLSQYPENLEASRDVALHARNKVLQQRDVDQATVTSTVTVPSNTTVTSTADPTTTTDVVLTTDIVYSTASGSEVLSTKVDIVTATTGSAQTQTVQAVGYGVTYVTKRMSVVWTSETTTTPGASITACARAGGHFADSA